VLIPCPECGQKLWTELGNVGLFRLVMFFDDDEGSDTYAERVDCCPGCDLWLYGLDAVKLAEMLGRK
jgi:hypothetical protein